MYQKLASFTHVFQDTFNSVHSLYTDAQYGPDNVIVRTRIWQEQT